MSNKSKKEAARKKSLGELGELFAIKALVDQNFQKIQNLNDEKHNFPFADLYAEDKDGKKYLISVKARNKYTNSNILNKSYNLGRNAYENASKEARRRNAQPAWMAIQFDSNSYSIYFGTLEELKNKNSISLTLCSNKEIGNIFVKDKRHYFDFSYFLNKKIS